mmetsp:Transcript_1152/g.3624  ORF Transcript_1152/g.3624 Transcript_1152/m.3624 type:complete len:213 (-) Transcript_1152:1388-2026(-)
MAQIGAKTVEGRAARRPPRRIHRLSHRAVQGAQPGSRAAGTAVGKPGNGVEPAERETAQAAAPTSAREGYVDVGQQGAEALLPVLLQLRGRPMLLLLLLHPVLGRSWSAEGHATQLAQDRRGAGVVGLVAVLLHGEEAGEARALRRLLGHLVVLAQPRQESLEPGTQQDRVEVGAEVERWAEVRAERGERVGGPCHARHAADAERRHGAAAE